MRSCLLLAVIAAGCGNDTPDIPDTPDTPELATVTLEGPAERYVITSEPPGLHCGRCDRDWPSRCPNSEEVFTDCSFVVPVGTHVILRLDGTNSFALWGCSGEPIAGLAPCEFDVLESMTATPRIAPPPGG